ncbi:MAG: hypothetical protein JW742_04790, partial [Candidatus Aminicenantes bacterium]|nr:hypothetical protein [Candidatus Aminicenantes bacterium]
FEPQYLRLSAVLENWKKGPVAVWHPELGRTCYFQNMSFDRGDVHFIVADWASRTGDPAALHDVPGGTWSWFADDLAGCRKPRKENIVILSHHPMWNYGALSRYGFAASDLHVLRALTRRYAGHIDANLGGHLHVNLSIDARKTAGHRVLVTDATFDDVNCLRLVYVFAQRDRIRYLHRVCRVEG